MQGQTNTVVFTVEFTHARDNYNPPPPPPPPRELRNTREIWALGFISIL